MQNGKVKHVCRNCTYYDTCGDADRAEPCKGRQVKVKTEQKANEATAK